MPEVIGVELGGRRKEHTRLGVDLLAVLVISHRAGEVDALELNKELVGRWTRGRVFGEAAVNHIGERGGHTGQLLLEPRWIEVDVREAHVPGRERELTTQDLVERDPELVDIRRGEQRVTLDLLGRHVRWGPAYLRSLDRDLLERAGEPEVDHFHDPIGLRDHVRGFDVSVNDAFAMQVLERARHLDPGANNCRLAQATPNVHHRIEIIPIDVLEDNHRATVDHRDVINTDEVRVTQRRDASRLGEEDLLGFIVLTELVVEHLDRDGSAEQDICRSDHDPHPSSAEDLLEPVAVTDITHPVEDLERRRAREGRLIVASAHVNDDQ